MTPEQRKALARAVAAHGLVEDGHGRYWVSHPWKPSDPEGLTIHTDDTFTYIQALRVRARYVAFCALVLSGANSLDAEVETENKTGKAIDIFKDGIASLGLGPRKAV